MWLHADDRRAGARDASSPRTASRTTSGPAGSRPPSPRGTRARSAQSSSRRARSARERRGAYRGRTGDPSVEAAARLAHRACDRPAREVARPRPRRVSIPLLVPLERGALTLAMLEDVLDVTLGARRLGHVGDLARRGGAGDRDAPRRARDPRGAPAAAAAIRQVEEEACRATVDALAVLLPDTPLVTPRPLTRALHTLGAVVVAPSPTRRARTCSCGARPRRSRAVRARLLPPAPAGGRRGATCRRRRRVPGAGLRPRPPERYPHGAGVAPRGPHAEVCRTWTLGAPPDAPPRRPRRRSAWRRARSRTSTTGRARRLAPHGRPHRGGDRRRVARGVRHPHPAPRAARAVRARRRGRHAVARGPRLVTLGDAARTARSARRRRRRRPRPARGTPCRA